MANTFDMVNNALMRQLERLDEADIKTDDGLAEIERAKAVKDVCCAAVSNAKATIEAMRTIKDVNGAVVPTPALLGGCGDD